VSRRSPPSPYMTWRSRALPAALRWMKRRKPSASSKAPIVVSERALIAESRIQLKR